MRHFIKDLKTTHKLALGFGSVLLLTLAIGATGWSAISLLGRSADRLAAIGVLSEAAKDLRIARLGYAQNVSQAAAQDVVKRLAALRERQRRCTGSAWSRPARRC